MLKIRVWSVLCLLCLLLAGCGSNPEPQTALEDTKPHDDHPTEDELTAMYAANALMQVWQEDRMACFGGAYTEGEQVVVLLTEDREDYRNEILKRTSFDDLVLFETCGFSMNYLKTLYDEVAELAAGMEDEGPSYNIVVRENCVSIRLLEVTDDLAAEWKALDTEGGGEAIQVSLLESEELPAKSE